MHIVKNIFVFIIIIFLSDINFAQKPEIEYLSDLIENKMHFEGSAAQIFGAKF